MNDPDGRRGETHAPSPSGKGKCRASSPVPDSTLLYDLGQVRLTSQALRFPVSKDGAVLVEVLPAPQLQNPGNMTDSQAPLWACSLGSLRVGPETLPEGSKSHQSTPHTSRTTKIEPAPPAPQEIRHR